MQTELLLVFSFLIIAMIYASVGFGGGSSYLALMGVMTIGMDVMRPAALLCNIAVVGGGTILFYKDGLLDVRKGWPFLVASVPLAFVGGNWKIGENTFFLILGGTLILAAIALWFQDQLTSKDSKQGSLTPASGLLIGGGIGFLSGLVSIGGGIFLSPVLHFIRWDQAKKISAMASLFILVNSISGLAGQLARSASLDWKLILPLLLAVLIGGQIGSRLGARRFNPAYIRRITAALIFVAGINIILNHI